MPVFPLVFFFFLTPGSHLFCNRNLHKQTIKPNCVMNYSYLGFKTEKKTEVQQACWGWGVLVGWFSISGFVDTL